MNPVVPNQHPAQTNLPKVSKPAAGRKKVTALFDYAAQRDDELNIQRAN